MDLQFPEGHLEVMWARKKKLEPHQITENEEEEEEINIVTAVKEHLLQNKVQIHNASYEDYEDGLFHPDTASFTGFSSHVLQEFYKMENDEMTGEVGCWHSGCDCCCCSWAVGCTTYCSNLFCFPFLSFPLPLTTN